MEFDGYYANDITAYESLAGLPNVTVTNVYIDSYNGAAGPGNDEVSLDIEMAISMAPGLSAVIVYEASTNNSGDDILNRMATDNVAKQFSSSWTFGIDSTTRADIPAICDARAILLQCLRRQRGISGVNSFAGGSHEHHKCWRDNLDHERSGRRLGVGNCLELVPVADTMPAAEGSARDTPFQAGNRAST